MLDLPEKKYQKHLEKMLNPDFTWAHLDFVRGTGAPTFYGQFHSDLIFMQPQDGWCEARLTHNEERDSFRFLRGEIIGPKSLLIDLWSYYFSGGW